MTASALRIHPAAQVAGTAKVGHPYRPLLDGRSLTVHGPTVVAAGAWIGDFTTIGAGAAIGEGTVVEDFAIVGPRSRLGPRVLVTSRSTVGLDVTVGAGTVINGFACDNSQVGSRCTIQGDLVHRQLDPSLGWDSPEAEEPAPVVDDGAFIGWRAIVIGVSIGEGAYVCAGALVTRPVPPGHVAYGRNQIIPAAEWRGELARSAFFRSRGTAGRPRPATGDPARGRSRLRGALAAVAGPGGRAGGSAGSWSR